MTAPTPPTQSADIGNNNFRWLEPDEERQLFDKRARALMNMGGPEFLRRLDLGEFDQALEEEDDLNLSHLVSLSDLGR